MIFKKNLLFCAFLFSLPVYSFGSFFQKNDEAEMFEYKPLIGSKQSFSLRDTEWLMHPALWMTPMICIDVLFLYLLKSPGLPPTVRAFGFSFLVGFNVSNSWDMIRFQNEAGKWLEELKEKKAACKNKDLKSIN